MPQHTLAGFRFFRSSYDRNFYLGIIVSRILLVIGAALFMWGIIEAGKAGRRALIQDIVAAIEQSGVCK